MYTVQVNNTWFKNQGKKVVFCCEKACVVSCIELMFAELYIALVSSAKLICEVNVGTKIKMFIVYSSYFKLNVTNNQCLFLRRKLDLKDVSSFIRFNTQMYISIKLPKIKILVLQEHQVGSKMNGNMGIVLFYILSQLIQ